MKPTPQFTTDSARMTFLRTLAAAAHVTLTDWETKFISTACRYQTGTVLFSEKQRGVIDRMFLQHHAQLYRTT